MNLLPNPFLGRFGCNQLSESNGENNFRVRPNWRLPRWRLTSHATNSASTEAEAPSPSGEKVGLHIWVKLGQCTKGHQLLRRPACKSQKNNKLLCEANFQGGGGGRGGLYPAPPPNLRGGVVVNPPSLACAHPRHFGSTPTVPRPLLLRHLKPV